MKKFLLAFLLCLLAQPVLAACPASLLLQGAAGVQAPAKYFDDGTGLCVVVMDSIPTSNLINAINSAIPSGSNIIGFTSSDPCHNANKTNLPISTNANAQLIAVSGSTTIYVCSLSLIAASAVTVAIVTGTGSVCATSNAAVIGSTTTNIANSMSLAANGGLTLGSGAGTVAKGAAASALCIILGTSVFVAGNLTYVQQ